MRHVPIKAKEPNPKTVVFKIHPHAPDNCIYVPKIKYEVIASVEQEKVFKGMVIPLPKTLLYFLTHTELMVVVTIIEETNENGHCAITVRDLATRLHCNQPKLSSALYQLRRMGLLIESPNPGKGHCRIRKLNYPNIQHLNDLAEGEDPGVYSRIRKATRKIELSKLTKEDVLNAYDNDILPPDHDPDEEEEYR